jgi:hypothetical protein
VTPAEIERYELYNERHGAKYVPLGGGGGGGGGGGAEEEEDDW